METTGRRDISREERLRTLLTECGGDVETSKWRIRRSLFKLKQETVERPVGATSHPRDGQQLAVIRIERAVLPLL